MTKKNILTRAKRSKADELVQAGRLAEARDLYARICQIDPADGEAWLSLSEVQRLLGDFPQAEQSARRAVALQPKLDVACLALGIALHGQGKYGDAVESFRQAVLLQPDRAASHYMLANALLRAGASPVEAVRNYRTALKLQPDFVDALCNLATVLAGIGEPEEAAGIARHAARLMPRSPGVLSDMGQVLEVTGRADEAESMFLHAIGTDSRHVGAIANLARLWEKTGRLPEARELTERGLRLRPDNPALTLVAARIARREERTQDGIDLLESLLARHLAPEIEGEARILLGQFHDRNGDAVRAFPLFVEGKRLMAMAHFRSEDNKARFLARSMESLGRFAAEELPLPSIAADQEEYDAPLFMIGFPRSGTTLLEQILDSHPGLQTLEEKGTVDAMLKAFLAMAGDSRNALAGLSHEQIATLRQIYFDEVKRHVSRRPDTLLIDKMPLNTANVPLILRVFPGARFILSIRHPCDVCLSCFMQNFAVNEGMAGFFALEDTVKVYSLVMGAWQKFARELPLSYSQVRYEDLIEDVEGESRRLLDFIGVPWDDRVLEHTEHARRRTAIQTPSYHQVTRPIYRHARYRWQIYRKEFEPLVEALLPFIEHFGYTLD